MSTDRLQYLLEKLFKEGCSEEELQDLALWMDTMRNEEEWELKLKGIWDRYIAKEEIDPPKAEGILKKIFDEDQGSLPGSAVGQPLRGRRVRGMFRLSVMAAAVIGLVIALSIVYVNMNLKPSARTEPTDLSHVRNDIAPGGNKAILVLANGQKILLDSAKNGMLTQMGNARVSLLNKGHLAFQPVAAGGDQSKKEATGSQWNTLHTPAGGRYQIGLPDGSRVWLNATSTIKFPSVFGPGNREVEVSGEAYFEIAQAAKHPFVVNVVSADGSSMSKVFVLGTAFNINAYPEESTLKTTLLEGKIRLKYPEQTNPVTLSPGEQAVVDSEGKIEVRKKVDTEEVLAWKDGIFDFKGRDIQSIMRDVARWYNVDVKYENTTTAHFIGTASRDVNLSVVLKMLEMTGAVHFRIEGRTVTVLP